MYVMVLFLPSDFAFYAFTYMCSVQHLISFFLCSFQMHVTLGVNSTEGSGYVETTPSSNETTSQPLALDCEMSYTTIGLELTRVTVVDMEMRVVYESLVKPNRPIVDYNTRWVWSCNNLRGTVCVCSLKCVIHVGDM